MKPGNNFAYFIHFLIVSLLLPTKFWAQSELNNTGLWRTRTRLQLGIEHDSNINEAPINGIDARCLKLMFQSVARRKFDRSQFSIDYQAGFQIYWKHPEENKLINELETRYSFSMNHRIQFGTEARGRLKSFLTRDNNHDVYGSGYAGFFGQLFLPWNLTTKSSARVVGLDYEQTDKYDFTGPEWQLSLHRPLNSTISARADIIHRIFTFKRNIASQLELTLNNLPAAYFDNQRDKQNQYGLTLEYGKKYLVHIQYWYDHNQSNVQILDFVRHRIVLLVGIPLSNSTLTRIYATFEDKNYIHWGKQVQPLDLDTERNENNFLIVDLSHDLSKDLAAIFRVAWYKNETERIGIYYPKTLANIALELKF